MAGRKSDFTLTKLDDLFTTQAQRDEEQLSKIRDIPLELIDDFPDHPFKVRDDEDMMQLVESVKERGVITPATVRQKEDGRYELVSGHRRKRACELAGFETLRSEIVDLNRDEATILMVESNFQRSEILPSEKAFAYKMRLEALSRQGKRTDLTLIEKIDDINGWLYHRIRMCIWKQWKKPRTKYKNLVKLGIPEHYASTIANSRRKYWYISNNKAVIWALNKERLINSGFYDLATAYQSVHVNY